MKTSAIIFAAVLFLTATVSQAANIETGKEKVKKIELQQADIQLNDNNLVVVRYSDTYNELTRKMTVRVYSADNELIFSKKFQNEGDVQLGFDISQFPKGNYTFELYKNSELVCSKQIQN